jgi:hypothetical protein
VSPDGRQQNHNITWLQNVWGRNEKNYSKTLIVGFYWRTCDFPVWVRVKHIVPVYNAHPSYKLKNLGKILHIIQP